ncbi:hypothetical protein [Nevskia soli]|uniref:hypothetical protein n=1 Tax=Nevskia soli TaxID=418856 RepID=UPI0004A6B941|nr:hypothetical protein [Nevskia soli]
MARLVLAFVASAFAALVVVVLTAVIFVSDRLNHPLAVALHFTIFGAVIVFPVTFVGGVPLYGLCRLLGWVNWWTVLLGGIVLSEAYAVYIYLINQPGAITLGEFATCGASGVVAALVFSRVAGIHRVPSQL